jgi:hypothetical protein
MHPSGSRPSTGRDTCFVNIVGRHQPPCLTFGSQEGSIQPITRTASGFRTSRTGPEGNPWSGHDRNKCTLQAAVERKTLENFTASLSDGTLAFHMQRLSEVARAAVVVEGRYSALFSLEHVPAAFIADGLARLQVRYPEIPVVFADSRKFAEEWTYRFLAAALADSMGSGVAR